MDHIRIAILALMICSGVSCTSRQQETPGNASAKPPAALTDERPSGSFVKRNGEDLVEELWAEKLEQSKELETLVAKIDSLQDAAQDSIKTCNRFMQKNESYYRVAEMKMANITDSLNRQQVNAQITQSRHAYEQKVAMLASLKQQLEKNQVETADQLHILKLSVTVRMLEQYQKNNLPSVQPAQAINKGYTEVLQQLRNEIKKYQ